MNPTDLQERLQLAISTGLHAGKITLDYFQKSNLDVQQKQDGTPVTIADRQAEEYLRSQIEANFNHDAILGEEMPDKAGSSDFRWILDPIDGTKSFIHGVPLYGTLIGVEYDKQSVIGVIVLPALDEYIYAANGQGAWYVRNNNQPIQARVSSVIHLTDGLFCTTSLKDFEKNNRLQAYQQLSDKARLTRCWGDCYGYVLVATGRAEIMAEPQLSLWDMAALQPIITEAGGTFTDWKGNPTIYNAEALATNKYILNEVLEITSGK
ncbi:MAG: histidinol-phosphatase [Planctomycetota bacterium]